LLLKYSFPPFSEELYLSLSHPFALGNLKLSKFAKHQLLVLLLESLAITNSPSPNHAQKPLLHTIAFLSPLVIGYLLPSFTLNRNEWGSGLEIGVDGDSHSAVVKPPKMKSFVV
jgi:hypothetical protein